MLRTDGLRIGRGVFSLSIPDLDIAPGRLVAVSGPNGGGKTTLLKTLAGLLAPRAGQVTIAAADIHAGRPRQRADLAAYLPPPGDTQHTHEARYVAALGAVRRASMTGALPATAEDRAIAALAHLGIGHLAQTPFERLSSGQRQLVLLARLLVQEPLLCLLDEPLATLDPANAGNVLAALRTLAEGGRTVLFSTHDRAAAAFADHSILIEATVRIGPPAPPGRSPQRCPHCGANIASSHKGAA